MTGQWSQAKRNHAIASAGDAWPTPTPKIVSSSHLNYQPLPFLKDLAFDIDTEVVGPDDDVGLVLGLYPDDSSP